MLAAERRLEVVLVGGGHSHVQVLRGAAMEPIRGARLTLVVDTPIAVYSGMVPGLVAGQYAPRDLEIDAWALARRAGATVIHARATRVDARERRLHLDGRPPIRFDVASLNVGSTVAGLDVPGVREHVLATRPIGQLVARIAARFDEARARAKGPLQLVVVGAGAAGVELAFALRGRAARERVEARVTLVESGARVLPDRSDAAAERVLRALRARSIEVVLGARVASVNERELVLDGGRAPIPQDLVLWAAGAAAPPWLGGSDLPLDAQGYVRVRPTLQVVGHDHLLAAGDCAVLEDGPWLPRSGVFAVREGPILAHNLRALASREGLVDYAPQRDFLALLNLGDGSAIGTKWGFSFEGSWVLGWKDRIDREFVERFRVASLGPAGMSGMGPPVCGGCAAKVGREALASALGRLGVPSDPEVVIGLDKPDDVAVLRRPGELVVTTIDAFPAFVEDAWLVGRIAAANAISDVEAKGVAPRIALAFVTVPRGGDEAEVLYQVLAGARTTLDAAGVTLAGGHTTVGPELVVGFAVTGFAREGEVLAKGGLRAGDRVILTRAIGTGVILHADMDGRADGRWVAGALASMQRGQRAAGEIARRHGATASTDVTGFGLAGHLDEMLRASGVAAEVNLASVPVLPGAYELLAMGVRSTLHASNRSVSLLQTGALARPTDLEVVFDPQTAGGLLFGVPEARAAEAVAALHAAGDRDAAVIATIVAPTEARPSLVVVAR